MGAAAVTNDLQAKREEELSDLKRNIEEETKRHEMAMKQLCSKHSGVVEELNLQLDTMKKVRIFRTSSLFSLILELPYSAIYVLLIC